MEFVKELFLISIFSLAAADIAERQLDGLTCEAPVLLNLLARFPEDMDGMSVCRDSVTNFGRISPDDYVERQDEVFMYLQEICDSDCLPFVADLVSECYTSFRVPLAQACASNAGGVQCWQGPTVNNGTEVAFNCYNTTVLGQPCTEDCRLSLTSIRSTFGCCVNNVFNTTVFGPDLAGLQVANGQLWDACGVERINFCSEPDAFSTVAPTAAASRVVSQSTIAVIFLALAINLLPF